MRFTYTEVYDAMFESDLERVGSEEVTERLNDLLAKKLAAAPTVYLTKKFDSDWCDLWSSKQKITDTHTAKLVNIEPLEKK